MVDLHKIAQDTEIILRELVEMKSIKKGQIIVIGTSTSEVLGQQIGTAGVEEVASQLFKGIEAVKKDYGFDTAFQCCEHLNRALVVERALIQRVPLVEVYAVPVPKAGGSMAAYAYRHMDEPCLVEHIQADAGMDIGDTFIGMHLRPVAVPFRASIRNIGQAHVSLAYSRPKLIGGPRAVYSMETEKSIDLNHC